MEPEIKELDYVRKRKGYKFEGQVRSKFTTRKGDVRFLVEEAMSGMLHVFNYDQLELSGYPDALAWLMDNRKEFCAAQGDLILDMSGDKKKYV